MDLLETWNENNFFQRRNCYKQYINFSYSLISKLLNSSQKFIQSQTHLENNNYKIQLTEEFINEEEIRLPGHYVIDIPLREEEIGSLLSQIKE